MVFSIFPIAGVETVPVSAGQVINDKKVSDHHAILPTRELQKCNFSELPKEELAVLQLICTRLLCAVGEPYRYTETQIELDKDGVSFTAKGKQVVQMGWKQFIPHNKEKKAEPILPELLTGEGLSVHAAEVREGKTTPPKHYTEDICCERGIRNHP